MLINDVNPRIARAELVYFSELFLCQKYVFSDPMPTQIAMPISPAQSWDLQEDGRWMQGISDREYATVITVLQRRIDNLE